MVTAVLRRDFSSRPILPSKYRQQKVEANLTSTLHLCRSSRGAEANGQKLKCEFVGISNLVSAQCCLLSAALLPGQKTAIHTYRVCTFHELSHIRLPVSRVGRSRHDDTNKRKGKEPHFFFFFEREERKKSTSNHGGEQYRTLAREC